MNATDIRILRNTLRRYYSRRRVKRETGLYPLETLIFFITMRCNMRCEHCFCWQDLNQFPIEPTLEEVEKFAATIPKLRQIVLSGGEPMLRKDIVDIVRILFRSGNVEEVMLNTAGIYIDKTVDLVREIKEEFPFNGLDIQVSIDGMQESHDLMRGIPRSFERATETVRQVHELKKKYPNLATHVLSIITATTHEEIVPLNDYLRDFIGPDVHHAFELVRDVDKTAWNIDPDIKEEGVGPKSMDLPPVEAFDRIARDLEIVRRRAPFHVDAYREHNLAQLKMVETGEEQYPCVTAGEAVASVYTNWQITHCEFTKPFANLREFDFDFQKLWHSEAADKRRDQIKTCHCTHGCWMGKAVEYAPSGLWKMFLQGIK